MDAVSQSIIGDFLPTPRIDRVVLKNEPLQSFTDNPHIVEANTPEFDINNELNAIPLSVNLSFNVKDTFGDNLVSSWFSNIDFRKYLGIYVIQVTDASLHAELKKRTLNKKLFFEKYQNEFEGPNLELKTVFLSGVQPGVEILDQGFVDINNDGKKYYNFNFNTTFTINKSEPSHLSYFYFSAIDVQALSNDYDFPINFSNSEYYLIEDYALFCDSINSELVFKNKTLKETGFIYGTKESGGKEVWKGKVVYSAPQGEYQGVVFNPNGVTVTAGIPLVRRRVKNRKIQDFRIRKKLFQIPIDMSFIENAIYTPLAKAASKDALTNVNNGMPAFFSDVLFTKASDEKIKMFFSFNMLEFLQRESKFNAIYNSFLPLSLRSKILNAAKYNMINVSRAINLEDQIGGGDFFIDNEAVDVALGFPSANGIYFTGPTIDNLPAGQVGNQVTFSTEKDNFGVHHFSISDVNERDNKNFDKYIYTIEVEAVDGIDNIFKQTLDSLIENLTPALQRYNKFATAAGFFNYDVNKFTELFTNDVGINADYDVIKNNIPKLIETIQLLSAPFITKTSKNDTLEKDFEPYDKFADKLVNLTSPKYGNPSGIAILEQISNQTIFILQDILGLKATNKTSETVSEAPTSPGSVPPRLLRTAKYVKSNFEEKFYKTGYDFLSLPPYAPKAGKPPVLINSNQAGLTNVTREFYQNRVDVETSRFYENIESIVNIPGFLTFDLSSKKYCFLTPTVATLGDYYPLFPVKENSFQEVPYKNAFIDAFKANIYNIDPGLEENGSLDSIPEDLPENQGQENNPFQNDPSGIDNPDGQNEDEKEENEPLDIMKYMPAVLEFIWKKNEGSFTETPQSYNLDFEKNKLVENSIPAFLELPNSIKSLFVASLEPGLVKYNPFEPLIIETPFGTQENDPWILNSAAKAPMFLYNFMYIYKVEYLSGYKEINDGPTRTAIKDPEWKELTSEIFNLTEGNLLCRLMRYTNPDFVLQYDEMAIDLPIYNEYFMLGEITYNPSEETIYPTKQINVEMDDNDTEDIHTDTDDTDPGSEPDSAPPADSSAGGGSAGPGGGY